MSNSNIRNSNTNQFQKFFQLKNSLKQEIFSYIRFPHLMADLQYVSKSFHTLISKRELVNFVKNYLDELIEAYDNGFPYDTHKFNKIYFKLFHENHRDLDPSYYLLAWKNRDYTNFNVYDFASRENEKYNYLCFVKGIKSILLCSKVKDGLKPNPPNVNIIDVLGNVLGHNKNIKRLDVTDYFAEFKIKKFEKFKYFLNEKYPNQISTLGIDCLKLAGKENCMAVLKDLLIKNKSIQFLILTRAPYCPDDYVQDEPFEDDCPEENEDHYLEENYISLDSNSEDQLKEEGSILSNGQNESGESYDYNEEYLNNANNQNNQENLIIDPYNAESVNNCKNEEEKDVGCALDVLRNEEVIGSETKEREKENKENNKEPGSKNNADLFADDLMTEYGSEMKKIWLEEEEKEDKQNFFGFEMLKDVFLHNKSITRLYLIDSSFGISDYYLLLLKEIMEAGTSITDLHLGTGIRSKNFDRKIQYLREAVSSNKNIKSFSILSFLGSSRIEPFIKMIGEILLENQKICELYVSRISFSKNPGCINNLKDILINTNKLTILSLDSNIHFDFLNEEHYFMFFKCLREIFKYQTHLEKFYFRNSGLGCFKFQKYLQEFMDNLCEIKMLKQLYLGNNRFENEKETIEVFVNYIERNSRLNVLEIDDYKGFYSSLSEKNKNKNLEIIIYEY